MWHAINYKLTFLKKIFLCEEKGNVAVQMVTKIVYTNKVCIVDLSSFLFVGKYNHIPLQSGCSVGEKKTTEC